MSAKGKKREAIYFTYSRIMLKNFPANANDAGSLGWEDTLEKEMATYSSIFAWKIPWTEKPGGLQFMRSQRVGHD